MLISKKGQLFIKRTDFSIRNAYFRRGADTFRGKTLHLQIDTSGCNALRRVGKLMKKYDKYIMTSRPDAIFRVFGGRSIKKNTEKHGQTRANAAGTDFYPCPTV
jgi:hypothetical protein